MDRVTREQEASVRGNRKKGTEESGRAWWWINRISFTSNTVDVAVRAKGKKKKSCSQITGKMGKEMGEKNGVGMSNEQGPIKIGNYKCSRKLQYSVPRLYFYLPRGFSFLYAFGCLILR